MKLVSNNRIRWFLFVAFIMCTGTECPRGMGGGRGLVIVAPSRLHNTVRAKNTTENLADLAVASCTGARATQAAAAASAARTAATNLQLAMDMFNESPEAFARIETALKAAAEASHFAYYMIMSCGGVPPEIPNIPIYTETFWDIASP